MLELLKALSEYGAIGTCAAIAIGFAWYKDRQYVKLVDENKALTNQLIEGYRSFSHDVVKLIDFNREDPSNEQDSKPTRQSDLRDNSRARLLETIAPKSEEGEDKKAAHG